MFNKLQVAIAGTALLLGARPGAAHHSFAAEFDLAKPVTLRGTVTKVDWVNPHSWIYLDVKGVDGKVTNWHFELGSPNALFRLGWKKDAVPIGIELNVSGYRAKTGEPIANAVSVTLPNGKEFLTGGSAPVDAVPKP
jgi:hypothetical protein